jgi:hypothetical protein
MSRPVNSILEDWKRQCSRAAEVVESYPPDYQARASLEEAQRFVALAHHWLGVACEKCGGVGGRSYASTATWRGGIGGQAITTDVCDSCWGTGRTDQTGPDLRRLSHLEKSK